MYTLNNKLHIGKCSLNLHYNIELYGYICRLFTKSVQDSGVTDVDLITLRYLIKTKGKPYTKTKIKFDVVNKQCQVLGKMTHNVAGILR